MPFRRTVRFSLTSTLPPSQVVARMRARIYDRRSHASASRVPRNQVRVEGHVAENAFALRIISPTRGYGTGPWIEGSVQARPTGSAIEGRSRWPVGLILFPCFLLVILAALFGVILNRTPGGSSAISLLIMGIILSGSVAAFVASVVIGNRSAMRTLEDLICEAGEENRVATHDDVSTGRSLTQRDS